MGCPVLIVLCFIPAILGNSRVYQNEAHFWERMYHLAPANAFLDYKYGQTFFQAGDYLKAEILFKEALKHPLKTDTAISLSLTQAQIEVNRANYSEANRWLERIALFRLNPNQSLAVSQVRVAILAATGEWQNAARLLNEASRRAPQLELYQRLYRLYLGYGQWQEADRIAAQIHHLKPGLAFKTLPPDQENRFSSWQTEQKIAFFIRYGNYGDAIRLIHSLSLNLEQHIGLAKLLYWHGEETAGKKAIDDLLQREGRQILLLNRLGNFYLNELYRWREALSYFKESLMLAPGQAEIARTAGELAKLLSDPPDLSLLKPR